MITRTGVTTSSCAKVVAASCTANLSRSSKPSLVSIIRLPHSISYFVNLEKYKSSKYEVAQIGAAISVHPGPGRSRRN